MQLTVRQLRHGIARLLENGVDTEMRNMAGFFMAGGVDSGSRDREASITNAPPGLGGPEDNEDYDEEEALANAQKKSQAAVRTLDRAGTTGR